MNNLHCKAIFASLLLTTSMGALSAENGKLAGYKNPDLPIEQRVDDLLSRMTLEEKIMQLTQYTLGTNNNINNIGETVGHIPSEIGSLIYFDSDARSRNEMQRRAMEESRLGIPILFGYDVIHGFRTIFAVPIAQACTWNPALVEEGAALAAKESRMSGVDWTFSPMVDVARDPRWGRVMEGYGEDPYATSVYAVAAVRGYQGDTLAGNTTVAACLKHFVGYGASEAGRDYVYTEISRQTLWDTYLVPFEAGVKAGAATLMSSFNDISGTPGSANHYTLTEILKDRWGHDGFVVSDWDAVYQLVNQGVAEDGKDAAEKAFMAGVEVDMNDGVYAKYLKELLAEGKVTEGRIDDAVRRVLRLKFRLGLFEDPYTEIIPEDERVLLPEGRDVAERLAEETMVLLKNDKELLPLAKNTKIALMGPLADNQEDLLGSWSAHGDAADVKSIYSAMVDEFGTENVTLVKGCSFEDSLDITGARQAAADADIIVLCLGEPRCWSGENTSRTTIALPSVQVDLLSAMKETGKPVVVLLANGRPLDLSEVESLADAMLEMWQPGIPGGTPAARILSGKINPSGKLAITFPYSTGQIPIYYNRRRPARTGDQGRYKNMTSEPLYEFGYGLSYSRFEYGPVKLSTDTLKRGQKITAKVEVKNVSRIDGSEVVFWYISDPVSTITRPVKELKHFEKALIPAGETRVFEFEIDPERDLSFVDAEGDRFLESGKYFICVGEETIPIVLED